jgi:DNA mismatch repair protein MutL
MPRIQQLPHSVVTKIAAGEVIERPASVVKELLENSIDAGSTRIEIDLEHGGAELIRVVDDGCGIEPDDLALAFASHATSKLHAADDLFRIASMGFRGEALASIGGVARVALQSRTAGQAAGAEIACNGGDCSDVRAWNGAPGTRIEVRHLFFNTPVRKKFLKTQSTELNHICETVHRLALANPTLHVVLRHNARLVLEVPASAGLRERIGQFFGDEIREKLYELRAEQGPALLTGFIGDPSCERGNAKLQYLFVNERWIRDRSLGHALQEAYRGLLMTGRYAVGFLFVTLPPDQVDVNVHPTKAEVRFRDSQAIYHLVRAGVKHRLSAQNLVPRLHVPPENNRPQLVNGNIPSIFESPRRDLAESTVAPWQTARHLQGTETQSRDRQEAELRSAQGTEALSRDRQETEPLPNGLSSDAHPLRRAIQIHDSYLVVETPDGMLVVDQHALHERILFEQLRRRIQAGQLEIQPLLMPEPVDLSADQAACVLAAKDDLHALGLDVEDFGGGTVLLASYPALLSRATPVDILKSVVDCLVTRERAPSKEQILHDLLATMACKAAVKAGDKLTPEEITYLMELRDLADDSHHCPHGRPTSLMFSKHELEKQFRRV